MNDTDEALRAAFHQRMRQVYDDAARLGYRPTRFLQRVEAVGGFEAARRLAELGYRFKEKAGPGEPCPD